MFKLLTDTEINDCFKLKSQRDQVGVYFYRIIGYDEELLKFLRKYQSVAQKKGVYLNKKLNNPDLSDIQYFYNLINNNFILDEKTIKMDCIKWFTILNNSQIQLVSDAIYTVLTEMKKNNNNLSIIKNSYVKFMYWLKYKFENCIKYIGQDETPKILYEGDIGKNELYLLRILSLAGCDIIYINFLNEESYIKYDPKSKYSIKIIKPIRQIPELHFSKIDLKMINSNTEVKASTSTVAYKAEKELDTILYANTGLYRNKQFKTCKTITLRTTYEEIPIIWKEDAKFRPGFKAEENNVYIPNIFAKVCGIKDGNINTYIKQIQELITNKTIMIRGFPYIKKDTYNPFYASSYKFVDNDKIDVKNIKKFKDYKYGFLNQNTQNLIFTKIQEIIDLRLIDQLDMAINQKIVATLLNINKEILNLIQQIDFTKDLPKIIITDVNENIASLQDSILLIFLNLIGFDIIIFTPTGYQNIENYINPDLFEEYQIGDYKYDLQLPNIRKKRSLLDYFNRNK